MDRDLLLMQLTALDFMATDLHLYLDTHPGDEKAIADYNEIVKDANIVRCQYENNFGPLCSFRSMSNDEYFTWVNDPWPWQKEFNFNI